MIPFLLIMTFILSAVCFFQQWTLRRMDGELEEAARQVNALGATNDGLYADCMVAHSRISQLEADNKWLNEQLSPPVNLNS